MTDGISNDGAPVTKQRALLVIRAAAIILVLIVLSLALYGSASFNECFGRASELSLAVSTERCFGVWLEGNRDTISAGATAIVAVFTLTLWLATRGLWKTAQEQSSDMKAAIAESKKSADAAAAAADIARQVEMPMVFLTSAAIIPNQSSSKDPVDYLPAGPCSIGIEYKNYGRTPAIIERIALSHIISETAPLEQNQENIESLPTGTVLESLSSTRFSVSGLDFTEAEILGTHARRTTLWVFGFIQFRDYLGMSQSTKFRLQWQPSKVRGSQFWRLVDVMPEGAGRPS